MIFSQITTGIQYLFLQLTKTKTQTNSLKLILMILVTVFFICFLSFFYFRKIYEVPVKYTEIDILHSGEKIDTAIIDIVICRDYNRNKTVTIQKTDSGYVKNKVVAPSHTGIIEVSGVMWLNKKWNGESQNYSNSQDIDSINAHLLDTIPLSWDHCAEIVNVFISGTTKQNLFYAKDEITDKVIVYKNSTLSFQDAQFEYEKENMIDLSRTWSEGHIWNCPMKYMVKKRKVKSSASEFCLEGTIVVSDSDKYCPINFYIMPNYLNQPNILTTLEDVSKLVEIVNIPTRTIQYVRSLTVDYLGISEFGYLNPEPDERTVSSIRYTDRKKLDYISWHGLKYHANFPDMENLQEIRIFALTAIITMLLTLLFSLIYKLFRPFVGTRFYKHPISFLIITICSLFIWGLLWWLLVIKTNVDVTNLRLKTVNPDKEYVFKE